MSGYFDPASPEGEKILLDAASPFSWQGWCRDVTRTWGVKGLLDTHGRFIKMTRKEFHGLPAQRLTQLQWKEINILCPPWGAFVGEHPTGDREKDGELRAEAYASWMDEG